MSIDSRKIARLLAGVAFAQSAATAVFADDIKMDVPPQVPSSPPVGIQAVMASHSEKSLLLGVAAAGGKVVAVGGNGAIVMSADGKAWKQVPSPVDVSLTAIAFADNQYGWAVGHDAVILATADGGETWQVQSAQPDLFSPLFSIQPIAPGRAIAVGAFGLIRATEDGGKTWADVAAPELTAQKFHLNAVTRLNSGKLFVAGEQGLMGVSDDGITWRRLTSPYEGSYFGALPWGERGALVYGMRGNVYVTDDVDAGEWRKLETGTTSSFFGGGLLDDNRVLLTGADEKFVLITRDGKVRAVERENKTVGQAGTLTGYARLGAILVVVGDAGVLRFSFP